MRRIERTHARRTLAVRAALSVFLVAAVGLGTARVVSTTPAGQTSLLTQPTPSDEPVPSVEVDPPAPTKEPKKPAKPKPTANPAESPDGEQPAKPKPADEPTYGPKPDPGAPAPKPTAEPTKPKPSPTETADGLSVELWPYTDAVAGQSMEWKVKAYDGAGRLLRVEVRFGDGERKVWEPTDGCAGGVNVKKFFAHTYAAAGSYTATATVTTGECGAATETKTVTSSVKVVTAESGNGPAKPTVTAEQVEAAVAKLLLKGSDADGFVKKFYVDWGDGSPETYVGPRSLDGCVPGEGSSWSPTASHEYAEPGTYTVTITVLSTNCDGGQGQTATTTVTVTV